MLTARTRNQSLPTRSLPPPRTTRQELPTKKQQRAAAPHPPPRAAAVLHLAAVATTAIAVGCSLSWAIQFFYRIKSRRTPPRKRRPINTSRLNSPSPSPLPRSISPVGLAARPTTYQRPIVARAPPPKVTWRQMIPAATTFTRSRRHRPVEPPPTNHCRPLGAGRQCPTTSSSNLTQVISTSLLNRPQLQTVATRRTRRDQQQPTCCLPISPCDRRPKHQRRRLYPLRHNGIGSMRVVVESTFWRKVAPLLAALEIVSLSLWRSRCQLYLVHPHKPPIRSTPFTHSHSLRLSTNPRPNTATHRPTPNVGSLLTSSRSGGMHLPRRSTPRRWEARTRTPSQPCRITNSSTALVPRFQPAHHMASQTRRLWQQTTTTRRPKPTHLPSWGQPHTRPLPLRWCRWGTHRTVMAFQRPWEGNRVQRRPPHRRRYRRLLLTGPPVRRCWKQCAALCRQPFRLTTQPSPLAPTRGPRADEEARTLPLSSLGASHASCPRPRPPSKPPALWPSASR